MKTFLQQTNDIFTVTFYYFIEYFDINKRVRLPPKTVHISITIKTFLLFSMTLWPQIESIIAGMEVTWQL